MTHWRDSGPKQSQGNRRDVKSNAKSKDRGVVPKINIGDLRASGEKSTTIKAEHDMDRAA